ncbi:MAG: sodium:solute symporter [Muribaculaceae bacterium]|nr:sodium:solute symporter [Muribaculaceae bacterium]
MKPSIVIIVIAAYFLLLIAISYVAGRRAGSSTFFGAERRTPWPIVAFAMIGASISGVTFVSVPGMVAANGYAYLQMILGFVVGYALIAFALIPMFYRRNLISIYTYLQQRFGDSTYRSGAWFFFFSKMLGAGVRFFVVCVVLQELVFGPLGIPFSFNVIVTIALIWLYTARSGVKAVIWTDTLKSFCLIMSVVLCIYFIARGMGHDTGSLASAVGGHPTSRIFFFDDPMSGNYFWKQFIAGVFLAVAMTGLDQDMMQRTLACGDYRQARKNLIVASMMQLIVVALFLVLGTLLVMYVESRHDLAMPQKSDNLFALVATHSDMPLIVGILFILGLISAAYSAAGSALTSLTTSFTIDILDATRYPDRKLNRARRITHLAMSACMGAIIICFYYISDSDAISAVYTLASYTYGPILGLFTFGMMSRRPVRDRLVPIACIAAPILAWATTRLLASTVGYHTGFELLLLNAAYTVIGLIILSKPCQQPNSTAPSGSSISSDATDA